MPEYPDITVYIDAIEKRILGKALLDVRLNSPFLLRTVTPSIETFFNTEVHGIRRVGKRVVIGFKHYSTDSSDSRKDSTRWMVFHLMIAGRFHWKPSSQKAPGKTALVSLQFGDGYLYLTEAGSKRRASLHLFDNQQALDGISPG